MKDIVVLCMARVRYNVAGWCRGQENKRRRRSPAQRGGGGGGRVMRGLSDVSCGIAI